MPSFILKYNPSEVELDDFSEIQPTIESKGYPSSIEYNFRNANIEVNLVNGRFRINDQWINPVIDGKPFVDMEDYRPVWFKRNIEEISLDGSRRGHEEIYFLGWQITRNGNNYKYFAQLKKDGSVALGEGS